MIAVSGYKKWCFVISVYFYVYMYRVSQKSNSPKAINDILVCVKSFKAKIAQ